MAEQRESRGRDRGPREEKVDDGMIEKLVAVNRVSKTVKGGRQFTFTALTAVSYTHLDVYKRQFRSSGEAI